MTNGQSARTWEDLAVLLQRARTLRRLGQNDEAETAFSAVLDQSPREFEALMAIGHLARLRGDRETSLRHFTIAAEITSPGEPWARLEQANGLRSLERLDEARNVYANVLAEHPGQLQALLGLGQVARAQGAPAVALGHFAAAAAVAPKGQPGPHLEHAFALRAVGREADAETVYAAILAEHPGQHQALMGLGMTIRARGDHATALEHFTAATQTAPKGQFSSFLERANTLRAMGRMDEAETGYAEIVAAEPQQFPAWVGLGLIARVRGDLQAAVKHFGAAAAVAPKAYVGPLLEQAHSLRALDRLEEAETIYAAVLSERPGQTGALMGLGLVARARGRRTEAADLFARAMASDPDAIWPPLELAAEHRDAGDLAAARALAEDLLARKPGQTDALMSIGRTERSAGRRAEALDAFRQAHEAAPENGWPLIEMAVEQRALAQPQEAIELFHKALEIDPNSHAAFQELGEMARIGRDPELALTLFRQAIAARPNAAAAYLGAARALSDLGDRAEAAAMLDAAEAQCGASSEIVAARIEQLRQSGHWHRARALARTAHAAEPQDFGLWVQSFQLERLLATDDALEACLAAAPAVTLIEQSRVQHFRGQALFENFQIDAAMAALNQALELRPEDPGVLFDLARVHLLALDVQAARADLKAVARLTASTMLLRGGSLNISQTHLGQLLDELALDRDALAELQALRPLAPQDRVLPLLETVRRFPDYTPAAMMLLIALRQAGMLASGDSTQAGPPAFIPNRIVQYWDSPSPPPDVVELVRGWREAHPSFANRLFDDGTAQQFLREHCDQDVLSAYRRSPELAQKADIFRLAYLFAKGGYYIDADDRCLAPLATVTPAHAHLVLYQEDYGTTGNNFIAAAPQHAVIGFALRSVVRAVNRGDQDLLWFVSGPGLLTRAVAQSLAHAKLAPKTWLEGVCILPRVALHHAVAMHCQVAYKQTDRHWGNTSFVQSGGQQGNIKLADGPDYSIKLHRPVQAPSAHRPRVTALARPATGGTDQPATIAQHWIESFATAAPPGGTDARPQWHGLDITAPPA